MPKRCPLSPSSPVFPSTFPSIPLSIFSFIYPLSEPNCNVLLCVPVFLSSAAPFCGPTAAYSQSGQTDRCADHTRFQGTWERLAAQVCWS